MNVTYDEYGRPFIILREQAQKKRLKGLEALKSHILAAKAVSSIMKTSLGPRGMDKCLVGQDGDVILTNDGATILKEMLVEDQIAKLLVQLSQSQDSEIGDGTTGVVVLAGALLDQAEKMVERGIHPIRIAKGYEMAAEVAIKKLNEIPEVVEYSKKDSSKLLDLIQTTLASKIVNKYSAKLSKIAVDAVLSVANFERKDVNMELIKTVGKVGGSIEDIELVDGIIIGKNFSHPQMSDSVENAKILILACPFEPPKLKTGHKLPIRNVEQYKELSEMESNYFTDMINRVKESQANVVVCQWGFDDEANHLLLANNIHAIRWVSAVEMELLAIATEAQIVPRFSEISPSKVGTAKVVREHNLGTTNERMIVVSGCLNSNAVTILVRGSNKMVLEEYKRALHDALCVTRTFIRDNRIVYGGGSSEIAMSLAIAEYSEKIQGVEQYAFRSFADALDSIPTALAENSGYLPIQTLADLKAQQKSTSVHSLGIDCLCNGTNDMKAQGVIESFASKQQQILLATQVVKMILKIDDVLKQGSI